MPLRWQEVALPLFVITVLLVLKHVPATMHLPLSRAAGVVAFGYAAFLALRLVQPEDAMVVDGGWSELRPSMVEYFACYGAAALAAVLLSAVIFMSGAASPTQVLATYMAVVLLVAGAFGIGISGLFTKVRWDRQRLEHRNAFGRETVLDWSDVMAVRPNWRGITISAANARITFSQFHGGAAELAKHATARAQRNAAQSQRAMAPWSA